MSEYKLLNMVDVRAWVQVAPGEFTFRDAAHFFLRGDYDNGANAMDLILILEGMVDYGELDRVGNKRGCYRPPKSDLVKMDLVTVSTLSAILLLLRRMARSSLLIHTQVAINYLHRLPPWLTGAL